MAKVAPFTLDPNPKFKIDVKIPRPGEKEDGVLTIHFIHHPIDEFSETMTETQKKLEEFEEGDPKGFDVMVAAIMHIADGWGFKEEFTAGNIRRMLVNYPRAFGAIHSTYYLELMGLREKN
jgi:hypothetical protein